MTDLPPSEPSGSAAPSSPNHARQRSWDPEQGWLTRWRSWRDPFPWLLLLDAVRPATWVSLLLVGCLAYWASHLASEMLERWTDQPHLVATVDSPVEAARPQPVAGSMARFKLLANSALRPDVEAVNSFLSPAYAVVVHPSPARWRIATPAFVATVQSHGGGVWSMLLHRIVHLAIWAIPAGLVMRYSVLTVTGRPRSSLVATVRLATRRFLALMLVALVPLVAVGVAGLFFSIPGWFAGGSTVSQTAAELLSLLAFPLALAAGVIGFGSLFAVPLGWAAVMIEGDGDAVDAISRGYEYAFRRPFHLVGYLLIAWLAARVLLFFANGICFAAADVAHRFFAFAHHSGDFSSGMTWLHGFLVHLPAVFASLLFWALVAGIYLLMRRAAGGQEIEEISEFSEKL